jgi:hypothetical protein
MPVSHSPFALSSRARNVFVWGTWGLLFLIALAHVWKYSHDIPFTDDWTLMVPIVTGQQPATLTWLWHQHVQHRLPLPLLMLHAGQWIGVTDLRATFYFYVCAMGILAFVMIMVAKRLRGRISYADAFFPLVLMHLGRPDNLLMPIAYYYSVPLFLAGILLVVIVGWGTNLTLGSAVVAGICLVLLSLCGSGGLVCLPLPVLWLGYVGVHKLRSGQPNEVRCGSVILAFVLFALVVVGLYFHNFEFGTIEQIPGYSGQGDSVRTRLKRAVQILAAAPGVGGGAESWTRMWGMKEAEPWAEWMWKFSGLAVAALLLISAVLLIVTLWNQPRERSRALGLLLFVGFVVCYALLLGWERRNIRDYYSTFPALGLCCIYYVWGLYASSGAGSFAQVGLFAFVCAMFPLNTYNGLMSAWWSHTWIKEPMEQALRDGAPPYKIIRYHRDAFWWGVVPGDLHQLLTSMRDAGCGNFRYMGEDPPFREVPLSLTPTAVKGLTWDKGTARVSGEDDYLIFPVPERRLVAGVRITYIHSGDAGGGPALSAFRLFWKRSDQKEFPPDQSLSLPVPWLETGPEERTTETIWIDETIDQLRIHPDNKPCDFKILKIVLLVPAEK